MVPALRARLTVRPLPLAALAVAVGLALAGLLRPSLRPAVLGLAGLVLAVAGLLIAVVGLYYRAITGIHWISWKGVGGGLALVLLGFLLLRSAVRMSRERRAAEG